MGKKNFKAPCSGGNLLPVAFEDQVHPGSFEFALCHLLDPSDLSDSEARYRNEAGGAYAYYPRVLPKIVLLAYLGPAAAPITSKLRYNRAIDNDVSMCCARSGACHRGRHAADDSERHVPGIRGGM